MKVTKRLLGWLNSVFDIEAHQFLAFRLSYAGGRGGAGSGTMTVSVDDAVLTTTIIGGPGQSLSIDLTEYTISTLAAFLAQQHGYSVTALTNTDAADLSASILLDVVDAPNGNLYGYTNPLWTFYEAVAVQIKAVWEQVKNAPLEMSTTTADGPWLDELGAYYGVPRMLGEADAQYGPRIIAQVILPKSNNIAMANAITSFTGQVVTVEDVVAFGPAVPQFNGAITYNGADTYDTTPLRIYGLFVVSVGYDLLGSTDPTDFLAAVTIVVNQLRAAGTQMQSLQLGGSVMSDAVPLPTDATPNALAIVQALTDSIIKPTDSMAISLVSMGSLTDAITPPDDSADTLAAVYTTRYNEQRVFDGSVPYGSGNTFMGVMEGGFGTPSPTPPPPSFDFSLPDNSWMIPLA